MTVAEILEQVKALTPKERDELVQLLTNLEDEERSKNNKQHSLTELRGLGKHIWEGVDAREYVNQLRDEWTIQR